MKKNKLILALLLGLCFFGRSQQYLFRDNHWMNEEMQVYSQTLQDYIYRYYFVNGDSLHTNFNYRKIYVAVKDCGATLMTPYESSPCPSISYRSAYVGLLREANKIWYFVKATTTTEKVLYRFDLVKGDTIYDQDSSRFVTIDSVIPNYLPNLKLFRAAPQPGNQSVYGGGGFIEGIGPTIGFMEDFNYFFPFEATTGLRCATANNLNVLYGAGPASTQYGYPAYYCDAWPNLILGIASISADEKSYLYPNPTGQLLLFKNATYNTINKFLIYNDQGMLVLTKKNVNAIDGIDVGSLKNGIYFAEIDYGTYKEKVKFVKE